MIRIKLFYSKILVFSIVGDGIKNNKKYINIPILIYQVEQVRDMERELTYMKEEASNIQEIRNSLPDFCPNSNELCLEDQC